MWVHICTFSSVASFVLSPVPHYLDNWCFIVNFAVRLYQSSNFIFFSINIVLAVLGLLTL